MADNKIISLNISERLSALSILNSFKGSLETLSVILEDIKAFSITDEEWEKAEKQVIIEGEGSRWMWDNEKGGLKDIEVSSATLDFLKKDIDERSSKNEFTLADKPYISLREKLN